jgi:hypothetical protein
LWYYICRVREDCTCYWLRLPYDGLHWILCENHPHSYQQYNSRRYVVVTLLTVDRSIAAWCK